MGLVWVPYVRKQARARVWLVARVEVDSTGDDAAADSTRLCSSMPDDARLGQFFFRNFHEAALTLKKNLDSAITCLLSRRELHEFSASTR